MEKFKEVKELTRQYHNGDAPSSNPAPPPRSATTVTNGNTEPPPQEIIPSTNSPQASPKPSNMVCHLDFSYLDLLYFLF